MTLDDSTTIRPPLPLTVASAEIRAPSWISTPLAMRAGAAVGPAAARFRVVPTATVPPPAVPEASTTAPGLTITESVASSPTRPPRVPAAVPRASMFPSMVIDPPTPSMVTRPC